MLFFVKNIAWSADYLCGMMFDQHHFTPITMKPNAMPSKPNHNSTLDDSTHQQADNANLALATYRRYLRLAWGAWLALRVCMMPFVMWQVTNRPTWVSFFVWQVVILLPMFFLTKVIYQSKNAMALILSSLVIMVYWAISASHLLVACYQKQMLLAVIYGIENILLAVVFFMLFLFTKKMPAMHKQSP